MAFNLSNMNFHMLRCSCRTPLRRKSPLLLSQTRGFQPAALRRASKDEDQDKPKSPPKKRSGVPAGAVRQAYKFDVRDLSAGERETYEALPPAQQEEWRDEAKEFFEFAEQPANVNRLQNEVTQAVQRTQRIITRPEQPKRKKPRKGLLSEGEAKPELLGEDPEFAGDEVPSMAHGDIEKHREMREYARMEVWELPLLYKLAKPFSPPTASQPLRFRQTTYMGESHPAAKKIVLDFNTTSIASLTRMTAIQRAKFIKLCGARYNPTTDVVKMSCESFETPAQNKRYLSDLVNTLIKEAQDSKDTFEDVPFDFRHHKTKHHQNLRFPEEWKIDAARREQLKLAEEERLKLEDARAVDGAELVKEALAVGSMAATDPVAQGALNRRTGQKQRAPRLR